MFNLWNGFGRDICRLEIIGDMWKCDDLFVKGFSDVVIINFYMLCSFMKDEVIKGSGLLWREIKFSK